jgi:iron(III) transport system substrate-binding protein
VILLVDAARLWKAETESLFQPFKSAVLDKRIPAHLRGKDDGQGSQWYGFSTRARVIVYNKSTVQPGDVDTYEKLADARNKGKLCTRSGSHPYNLSLFGAVTEHLGPQKAEAWMQGLVNNMARAPKGGDTDQIKAVASGECGIGLTNSYYVARLMRSSAAEDKAVMEKVGIMFPNQSTWGTHLNISGGGIAKHAKNVEAARKFLEYLASDAAQAYFANGNNEWPVVSGLDFSNPALEQMGKFKPETIPVSVVGMNQVKVQQMLDRVGYR